MAKRGLFDGEGVDPVFESARRAEHERSAQARVHCEELWKIFEPYADEDFPNRIRTNFHSCYWEMHLATYFILKGADVLAPKPGPDIGIVWNGRKIWFECVCPTRGDEGTQDFVPPLVMGKVYEIPNEKLVLRYLNSVHQKTLVQYPRWRENGAVAEGDAYVVAINPVLLQHEWGGDSIPPRLLLAAYPVGPPFVSFSRETLEVSEVGYRTRTGIKKASGSDVATGVFDNPDYRVLSGLLCSRVNVANNHPEYLGADFQLAPNPRAAVLLPDEFRLDGTYFQFAQSDEDYTVTPIETAFTPSSKM